MNINELWKESNEPKHQAVMEMFKLNLMKGDWDGPRFTNEVRRYLENFDDEKHQQRITYKSKSRSNVFSLSALSAGLRKRPSYDGIA